MSDDHYHGQYMAHRHFEDEWSIGETYATRQEAIDRYGPDSGELDGAHFKTAKLSFMRQPLPCPYGASNFCDAAADNATSEWSEGSIESYVDAWTDEVSEKFDAEIGKFWERFCEKHNLYVEGYFTLDVEDHIVGDDESEEELARRAKERVA